MSVLVSNTDTGFFLEVSVLHRLKYQKLAYFKSIRYQSKKKNQKGGKNFLGFKVRQWSYSKSSSQKQPETTLKENTQSNEKFRPKFSFFLYNKIKPV